MSSVSSIILVLVVISLGLTLGLAYRLAAYLRKYRRRDGHNLPEELSETDVEIDLFLFRWALVGWGLTILVGAGLLVYQLLA